MDSVNQYHKGQMVRISGTYTVAGVATDPTTVTFKVLAPGGTMSTYTYALAQITKDGVGLYHKDISCSEEGIWHYTTIGTGAVEAVDEQYFEILPTVF